MPNPLSPTSLLGKALAARAGTTRKNDECTERIHKHGAQILAAMQTEPELTLTTGSGTTRQTIRLKRKLDPHAPERADGCPVYVVEVLLNGILAATLAYPISREPKVCVSVDRWVDADTLDSILSTLTAP